MPEPSPRETLPPAARIRSRKAFAAVFQRRTRASDARVTVYAAPTEQPLSRLGISVGRRWGGAVQRNRIKRLIREAFRRIRHRLPPGVDWIVIPQPGADPTLADLQDSLQRLSQRLRPRLDREDHPTPRGPASGRGITEDS